MRLEKNTEGNNCLPFRQLSGCQVFGWQLIDRAMKIRAAGNWRLRWQSNRGGQRKQG